MKPALRSEILDQHVAILAKTGRGKTVTAKLGAEFLLDKGQRIGVVDPTAAWWGLRLEEDGKRPAFQVVIFGGDHADIPITPRIGGKIGKLVAEADWSWIVDISAMGTDDRTLFMTEFAEALFAANRRRLNLFLDECHLYMPQQKLPSKASAKMTAACNHLVSGGRSRGLCITMISQRSAKVNKDALTQAETLITLGMIAPQDIAAAKAWVEVQGDVKAATAMLQSLPSLPVGTGWVYAPELGMLEKIKFPMCRTFDSSRAPALGEELRSAPSLKKIDLDEIRKRLDPKSAPVGVLRDKPGKAAPSFVTPPGTVLVTTAEISRAANEAAEAVRATIPAMLDAQHVDSFRRGYMTAAADLATYMKSMSNVPDPIERKPLPGTRLKPTTSKISGRFVQNANTIDVTIPSLNGAQSTGFPKVPPPVNRAPANGLAKAERAILGVLAHFPDEGAAKTKVALMAGYSASGGGFNNALSSLRTAGLLQPGEPLRATADGLGAIGDPVPLPTGEDLLAYWCGHSALGKAEREILTALVRVGPNPMTKEAVADMTGYQASGGGFNNAISRLRTLELISGRGELRAAEEFA